MTKQMPAPSHGGIPTSMLLQEEPQFNVRKWYFSRYEIVHCSPSRKDCIDFEKETQLRKQYCSYIQDLGKKLKVPQVTIACALMLCHRFYMGQSHMKNDWKTIATASMFLACKIEDTPRMLRDVVIVAHEIIYQWDPLALQRIRRIEFCNEQKELIITAERLLLTTIAFDFDIQLPYRPLVDALKKLNLFPDIAKVAWNFVNDWLCTTLCLQYKPHYIAAGSLFLAAKFQKVKLPMEKGKIWWLEFDIAPKHLEEVIQEMVQLLERDKKQALPLPPLHRKVANSRDSAGKMIINSPQSTVTSVSITSSHSSHDSVAESQLLNETNYSMKNVLLCHSSDDAGSGIVVDGDEENSSRKGEFKSNTEIVSDHSSYSKIDLDRIREKLKKRRLEAPANKFFKEPLNADINSEAWIENELENGIELESTVSEKKKQRRM